MISLLIKFPQLRLSTSPMLPCCICYMGSQCYLLQSLHQSVLETCALALLTSVFMLMICCIVVRVLALLAEMQTCMCCAASWSRKLCVVLHPKLCRASSHSSVKQLQLAPHVPSCMSINCLQSSWALRHQSPMHPTC